jgi:hypothetical protein
MHQGRPGPCIFPNDFDLDSIHVVARSRPALAVARRRPAARSRWLKIGRSMTTSPLLFAS